MVMSNKGKIEQGWFGDLPFPQSSHFLRSGGEEGSKEKSRIDMKLEKEVKMPTATQREQPENR
jgi:hypothetical protein